MLDFALRHGFISADEPDYVQAEILKSYLSHCQPRKFTKTLTF